MIALLAVKRTMAILQALSAADGLGVMDLSRRLEIHKADVSRILSALEELHYVVRDPETGRYHLGYKFVAMALQHVDRVRLEDVLDPVMREVAKATGELVQFAILQQEELIFIHKVEGEKPLRVASMLGMIAPPHATAVGKVWLASLEPSRARALLQERGMPKITEHTITDLETLMAELDQVRQQGYALSREEINPSVVGLAVPVFDGSDRVMGGLVVTLPVFEASPERLAEIGEVAKAAAHRLSEQLRLLPASSTSPA